jgi:hypothetical protein
MIKLGMLFILDRLEYNKIPKYTHIPNSINNEINELIKLTIKYGEEKYYKEGDENQVDLEILRNELNLIFSDEDYEGYEGYEGGSRRNKATPKPKAKPKHEDMTMKDIKEMCKANLIKLSKVVEGKRVVFNKKELITKLKRKKLL